ncbi:DEAD/DEAH box helicase family protein [Methanorbis rubei]|uniref:Helicase ATP-binding domain-containing protein n=1 Tax=Methanorbis rubei TaxID=3028300 RepID=A0AAE4SC77_9EURY|nr:hypothetical protein [Methanocorpusculaceae archaeon Cs1]
MPPASDNQPPKYQDILQTAQAAEKLCSIDTAAAIITCRRALELSLKWLYAHDKTLIPPYQDNLAAYLNSPELRSLLGPDLHKRINYIRILGNAAAHSTTSPEPEQTDLACQNLNVFLDHLAASYISDEIPAGQKISSPKPLNLSEYKTRKLYIDTLLMDAGWTRGRDWLEEYELAGMPNKAGLGYADYVLFGDDGKPLAVIEAKKTCKDPAIGRQQAKLYADLLEQKFGIRPIIFLTNGFDTKIWDDVHYPERPVSGIYAKFDLQKEHNKHTQKTSLEHIIINENIAGRYYQKEAITAVTETFGKQNRRHALLVMATGSGKTRTVIALVALLLRSGWIKNILFLADRTSLVTQAKRSFANLLPDLAAANLCEEKNVATARAVFSTYQTMMNAIDDVRDEDGGKLFTCGHFDLIIIDEAHRSIYNKYKDIFTYFDAHLIGLTATPKDEIDKNTYETFRLESGIPTYGYDLAQAVADGYLVDFVSIETKLKFLTDGIIYDELTEEEKEEYEKLFLDENGEIPQAIDSSALNEWIFNADTIKEVLATLFTHGIKIGYGSKIGKTILFAKNHAHAEKIYEIFGREYPNYPPGYVRVIDNYTNYAQSLIDEFSNSEKYPQIAISVDMLDTGIDIPEVVNLVFFKKVLSKAKFWQMIGRGTRLCPGLIDGSDKDKFYIFDFCGNFEFFRVNDHGRETDTIMTVQECIFSLQTEMAYKLQEYEYQTESLRSFRRDLISDLLTKVKELNRDNFAVRQHLRYIDRYREETAWQVLTYEDTLKISEEIAPLILPSNDEASAVRFDALLYGLELAWLVSKPYPKARKDLLKKVRAIADISTIPEILAQKELIGKILHTDYVKNAGISELEHIRNKLRDLMKYLPAGSKTIYDTNFSDKILETEWHVSDLTEDYLRTYKEKAIAYLREHQNVPVISKLRTNVPLDSNDITVLENILWKEVGSHEQYKAEYGSKPLGVFVREIVGLDMNAAKEAFSIYLQDARLNQQQIYFLNRIVEYIVKNGMMTDMSVLQGTPFTDKGTVVDLFSGDQGLWNGIRQTIEKINANAQTV